jgi:2-dehydropantoate 2-reductase
MRFVICGAGAIGGVVAARLHQAGLEVALIARGAHYEAIRGAGLTLETPAQTVVLEIPVVDDPAALAWREDDVILLATKSHDSAGALAALAASAPRTTPLVAMQNGVENERVALRTFANVYGAVVMVPAAHLEPGIVQAYGSELTGAIDVGRYPAGVDHRARALCEALAGARFSSSARPDVMRLKYAKLIINLANAVEAICGPDADAGELVALAREEGRTVLRAAGIEFTAPDVEDVRSRWERIGVRPIAGRRRGGSSTWQSLARGSGGVETDYLNGEIVLLGRLHGVATPVNELITTLVAELIRDGRRPGRRAPQEVVALL